MKSKDKDERKPLTGMEVWRIVAPILGQMVGTGKNVEVIDTTTDCYITVFHALKEYDEKRGQYEV